MSADASLDRLLKTQGKVVAFTDPGGRTPALSLVFSGQPMLDDVRMNLLRTGSTSSVMAFGGKFKDGTEFKLLVPTTEGLTDAAKQKGIKHIISLYVGEGFEKELVGNYFIF
jgi:hypothetical protein